MCLQENNVSTLFPASWCFVALFGYQPVENNGGAIITQTMQTHNNESNWSNIALKQPWSCGLESIPPVWSQYRQTEPETSISSNLPSLSSLIIFFFSRFKGNPISQWNNLWQMLAPSNLHLMVLGVIFSLELFVCDPFWKWSPVPVCERFLAHWALRRLLECVLFFPLTASRFQRAFKNFLYRLAADCAQFKSAHQRHFICFAHMGDQAKNRLNYDISSAVHLQALQ